MKEIRIWVILMMLLSTLNLSGETIPVVGAERTTIYLPLLEDRRIGIFTNQTGIAGGEHIVDRLHSNKINITAIFSPEHGFRGDSDAGEKIMDGYDARTGIPVYSLYKNSKFVPDSTAMSQIDVLLVDIQDVGLRFYTYYITLYYLMDACANTGKPVILLDRPNPNGFYVDGPLLDMKHKSGVGYLPIPVVHGMTLGELARMINGEQWLPGGKRCKLHVIPCENYSHLTKYHLPIPPSPNLPNMKSVYLYPSTCLFEGTKVSLGRGTKFPFQVYGAPSMPGNFSFTPRSIRGAKNPPYLNRRCFGVDLRNIPDEHIFETGFTLQYIIDAYVKMNIGEQFFTPYFEKLTGVDYIRTMIIEGKSAAEIKSQWRQDVESFKEKRAQYLIYN
ncbi:MAG: DUF1343 domain-containing protein [Dysgonamonadaceae bacterium]|nr:DUF1343 domain-containing protein [Dysgonamonadaceae bacterium]